MSTKTHKDHGTVGSYVIGFILSLVFTIIPYYLVVGEILTGTSLLLAILGIAIVQMFIQIFFFLHLGRGPKPFYNIVFFFATAGLIVIVVGASMFIMDNLYRTMSPKEVIIKQAQKENIAQIDGTETGACTENKQSHVVTIRGGVANPSFIEANLCDTLTFVNEDTDTRTLNFGDHTSMVAYGGEDEVVVDAGKSETITLNQTGTFGYFDHMDKATAGSFTVTDHQDAAHYH